MASKRKKQIKNRVGSYPYVNVMFSIVTALFIIGSFSLLAVYANRLTTFIRENIEIRIFLNRDLTDGEKKKVQREIEAKEYFSGAEDVSRIYFFSKEEAAERMIRETGQDFSEFLGENPLRDAFIINISEEYYKQGNIEDVVIDLGRIQGVFEVDYTKNMIDDINNNIEKIGAIAAFFVATFLVTVVILINNAIKLALFSQRFLIRSMQLVGATSFFIKKPFLYRATLQGVMSGIIASLLLFILLYLLMSAVDGLQDLFDLISTLSIFAALTFFGGLIGFLSAYSSVSRYLKMQLDELY